MTDINEFDQSTQTPHKKSIAIAIIGGLVVAGIAAFAYFNASESPEKVMQNMFARTGEVKSAEYNGEIKAEILGSAENNKNKIDISFHGAADIQNLEEQKSLISLTLTTDAVPFNENFSLGIEIRSIGKIIYVKINGISELGLMDLSAIENQWIEISPESLEKFGLSKESLEKQFTPEETEEIKIAFQNAGIIKITGRLGSETINGKTAHHYKFTIDKTGFKRFLIELKRIAPDKFQLTEEEIEQLEFDKELARLQMPEGEIWIGKEDYLPYKVAFVWIIEDEEKINTLARMEGTLFFENFNQPVQINIPANSKPLQEMEIMSKVFSPSSISEMDVPVLE